MRNIDYFLQNTQSTDLIDFIVPDIAVLKLSKEIRHCENVRCADCLFFVPNSFELCSDDVKKDWLLSDRQTEKRREKGYSFKGETKALKEWAEIYGISHNTVKTRMLLGWSLEEALTIPVRKVEK